MRYHALTELIKQYNKTVVRHSCFSYWSWTGGSVTECDVERDGEECMRGKMIAQTARVLDWHEKKVAKRRKLVDIVRQSGDGVYWIETASSIEMATRSDGLPCSWRFALTLASRRSGGHRLTSKEAEHAAIKRLAEAEAVQQDLHDVMSGLMGRESSHRPTLAEMWPDMYGDED